MEAEQREAIERERFWQLARTLPTTIGFGAVLAVAATLFLYRSQLPLVLLAWFGAQLLLSTWRLSVIRAFRRRDRRGESTGSQMHLIRLGCLLSGLLWGSMALLRFDATTPEVALFIAFLLAGVTAGGTTAMAADFYSGLVFQVAVLSLLAVRLLLVETHNTFSGMGVITLLYMVFMAMWSGRLSRTAIASIRGQLGAQRREQQLQQREARYRELAHQDALTGLPNRLSLQSELPLLLEAAADTGARLAVLYIDLDHFKDINDSRGHRCGDALLATTAERLRQCVRPNDLVARMGGDEFIVVGFDTQSGEQAEQLAQRLALSIGAPLQFENDLIHSSASMGIALYPDHGRDVDALLRHADIALYAAKAAGRDTHAMFTIGMQSAFSERIFLQQALVRAIGSQEMFLEYQPLIDLSSGMLTGFEALLRWRHPERGLVPPLDFIPVAEHCGLIDALGNDVAQRVCRQLARWRAEGLPLLPVSINVSPRHFERGQLAQQLRAAAEASDLEPSLLRLEITETALMKGWPQEAATLDALKQLGMRVMIDDFGIGYSSLNHLKSLPIDGLKIDRSFVRDMTTDERDAAIVSAIIGIARSLGIGVLAEGVESWQHVQQLRALGCEHGQGNYLYAPVTSGICSTLLEQHARGEPAYRPAPRLQVI